MTKPTKLYVRPAKTQISLVAEDPIFLHADSEVSLIRLGGQSFVGFVMRRLNVNIRSNVDCRGLLLVQKATVHTNACYSHSIHTRSSSFRLPSNLECVDDRTEYSR